MDPSAFPLLYPGLNPGQIGLRIYALRCIAHRLRKFGFEDGINLLPPADLRVLASIMPPDQAKVLAQEADKRFGELT